MNTPARFLPTLFDRLSDEAPHQAVEGSAQRLYSLADYTASLVRDLETLVNTRQPALQANAVQAAWLQALNTLPKGQKPARVFYDSTDNTAGEIALTNALHALNVDGHGLELGNVKRGMTSVVAWAIQASAVHSCKSTSRRWPATSKVAPVPWCIPARMAALPSRWSAHRTRSARQETIRTVATTHSNMARREESHEQADLLGRRH